MDGWFIVVSNTRLHDEIESDIPGPLLLPPYIPSLAAVARYNQPISEDPYLARLPASLPSSLGPLAEDTRGLTDSLASRVPTYRPPTGLPSPTGREIP